MDLTEEAFGKCRFPGLSVSQLTTGRRAGEHGDDLHGTVRDVSAGGVLAELPVELHPGAVVHAVFQTRRGPVAVEGKIGWRKAAGTMVRHGMFYFDPKDRDFALHIFSFLRRCTS